MSLDVDRKNAVKPGIVLTPAQQKSRRARNIAIGLAVGLFAVLFYVVTIVKLGPGILNRPL
ncbi:MAG: hypothetical protein NVSMB26_15800 [Beijerinckiaceae bacterium]